jgi:hypothetical protein
MNHVDRTANANHHQGFPFDRLRSRSKTIRVYQISEENKSDLASAWFAPGVCLGLDGAPWPPVLQVSCAARGHLQDLGEVV